MSSHAVQPSIDLESLAAPIAGANPTGEALRYEGAYDRILEARREDDATLTQRVWKTDMKKADWQEVERLCASELQARSKDLQIAAWLLEAWLHLHHFAGVASGLELVKELLNRYWDDLYPRIEGEDLEYRIAPITWINEKLSIQLKLLPITAPRNDEVPAYCWGDWENACRSETSDAKGRAEGRLSLGEFQKSVMLTATEFLAETAADVERAMEACAEVESILDQRCGKGGPSLRQFWSVMDSVRSMMISWLAQRPAAEESRGIGYAPVEMIPQSAEAQGIWAQPNTIMSRDDAYQRLAEAAEYLARTEPHSPTPYLIRRAIAWGSLTLPELLRELVRGETELAEILRLLQVNQGKPTK
jgi:type VI secretion system protein ImpA